MVYGNIKTIRKIIWTHFYSAQLRYLHRKTGFNIIYRWFLKYWQVNVECQKIDACLRHALDLHSIIYNSAVQLQFFLIGLNVNICFESAILETDSRNTTGYFSRHCDFKEAFSHYLLSKNWTVAERKTEAYRLPQELLLGGQYRYEIPFIQYISFAFALRG